jgi:hypothetical protein
MIRCRLDPLRHHRRRFVFAAFRFSEFGFGGYQFATEGFRKDGLGESPTRLRAVATRTSRLFANAYNSSTRRTISHCSSAGGTAI